MKIGDAGEAFFIFETDEDIPADIATSPLLQATKPGQTNTASAQRTGRFGAKEDEVRPSAQNQDAQEPDFLDLDASPSTQDSLDILPPIPPQASSASDSNLPKLPSMPPGDEAKEEQEHESGLLARTAAAGKAALGMAHEVERAGKDKIRDHQVKEAIKDLHHKRRASLEDSIIAAKSYSQQSLGLGGHKDDEILPEVPSDKVEAPEVTYGHGKYAFSFSVALH